MVRKQYDVIVENHNGVFHAMIPTLPNISAEGFNYYEAVNKAQLAAEEYLSRVNVTTIEIHKTPMPALNPRHPRNWIESAGMFVGDEEAMVEHIEGIYAERRRQREEVEREYDLLDTDGDTR